MITKIINDVLSAFTTYIVDNAADPGYLPQLRDYIAKLVSNANADEIISHIEILSGEIVAMSTQTKDYLNVYQSTPTEAWAGGVCLIAAETEEKANAIVDKLNEDSFSGYSNCNMPVHGLRYIGESGIIFDATYRE